MIHLDKAIFVPGPHPATLPIAKLLTSCELQFGQDSGPGGQHKNKKFTAVTITHSPTKIQGWASERRSQAQNKHQAIKRLRMNLAKKVRVKIQAPVKRSACWEQRRGGGKQISINPKHEEYPSLVSESLDVLKLCNWDVAAASSMLAITMSQLVKLLRNDPEILTGLNHLRELRGLPRLR
tara:strand:- start:462 stop:1001 length:540 start_codon:yes stop_codon:yes gene_type:complete